MSEQKRLGTALTICAGICWGLISIFIRRLNAVGMDSFKIAGYRALASDALLLVYFLVKDAGQLRIKLKDIWIFLGSGILSLTFFSFCYFTSIIKSGAAVAVVLLYTSPIFVMIISCIFFGENMTRRKLIALAMTFAGSVLISGMLSEGGTNGSIGLTGLLLGIGSGFGYALYSLFAGIAIKKGYSSLTITFYTFLFSGISLVAIKGPKAMFAYEDLGSFIWIIGIALICTVIPYITYTEGMRRIEVSKAAVIVTVEPLVGSLLGILAYHEPAGLTKLIGITLILVSVVILS